MLLLHHVPIGLPAEAPTGIDRQRWKRSEGWNPSPESHPPSPQGGYGETSRDLLFRRRRCVCYTRGAGQDFDARPLSAIATPPRMANPQIASRGVKTSPRSATPPAAASAGTASWTMAARADLRCGIAAYQRL